MFNLLEGFFTNNHLTKQTNNYNNKQIAKKILSNQEVILKFITICLLNYVPMNDNNCKK